MIFSDSAQKYVAQREEQLRPALASALTQCAKLEHELQVCLASMVRLKEERLRSDQADTYALRIAIGKLQSQEKTLRAALAEAEAVKYTADTQALHREFEYLQQIPRVWSVVVCPRVGHRKFLFWRTSYVEYWLTITTDTLYGYSRAERTWHDIGRFTIEAPMILGKNHPLDVIRWKNRTRTVHRKFSPNGIDDSGKMHCIENTGRMLLETSYSTYDYPRLVSTLVRIPEVDAGREWMRQWPQVPASAVPHWYRIHIP